MKPKEYTEAQKSMSIVFATYRQFWSWKFAFEFYMIDSWLVYD